MEYKSVFFPTEMDLYDALFSNGQKITQNYLIELVRDRGILVSEEDDREYLARYVSLFNHDYFEFKGISEYIARHSRNDKLTSEVINTNLSDENINEIYKTVAANRPVNHEKFNIKKIDENITRIEVVYDEIDHSKTKMIQKVSNEAYIDIINIGGETKFRYTANQRMEEIKRALISVVPSIIKKEVVNSVVTFENIADTGYRTQFFTRLIANISGFDLETVTKVKLSSKQIKSDDSEAETEAEELEDEITDFIKSASFDGNGLLQSPIYKQLEEKGYFITLIRWVSIEKGKNPNKYEMETSFENSDKGSGFKYAIRGIYRNKGTSYTQKRPVKEDEERILLAKIENSSKSVFVEIIDSIEKEDVNES